MNVDDLRDLAADIATLLKIADQLEPVVMAYAAQKALQGSPAAAAVNGQDHPSEPVVAQQAPAARQLAVESAARPCEACGAPFTPGARGGLRQRFCNATCRQRAMLQRRKAAAGQRVEPAEPPEPPGHPEPVAAFIRPMGVVRHPDDPEREKYLRPPLTGIPAVDAAAG